MGNSKTKPGIYIQTDRPFYLPGQVVHGCVYINAPKPFPISRIILNIKGVEKTWWKAQNNKRTPPISKNGSNQNINTSFGVKPNQIQISVAGDKSGENKIIESHFVLNWNSSNGNSTLHGQFAFPFEFCLPQFIPGSFKEETSDFKASVFYEVSCHCTPVKAGAQDLIVTQELIIRQPSKGNQESLFGEIYLHPKTCGCFSKGVCRICCYFEKNQYCPGDQCIAICEADNFKGNLEIKEIKVRFKKIVILTSGFGEQKTIIKEINNASFPGVKPNHQYIGESAKRISIPLKYKDTKTSMHPSTSGRLVKCQYFLEVTPVLGGCCTKNVTSFSVALNILQEGLITPQIVQPENWNPEVFRKSEIILSQNLANDYIEQMGNNQYY